MYSKRPATTVVLVVVILIFGMTLGCHEATTNFKTIEEMRDIPFKKIPTVNTTTVTIDATCEVSPSLAETWPGHFVEFCNNTTNCNISIVFEERALFADESLTLAPGECVRLRVMSDTDRDDEYLYHVYCCGMAGHSTPEIKVSPPPPPGP